MAKTIFIISTSNFATLQKPVFSKRCFAQKHPQPLLILGENLMQNASFQKTLKTTYHSSSADDTCPKQIYSIRAVHFQVNSWMNSLPSRRIQYDGLAQTGVPADFKRVQACQASESHCMPAVVLSGDTFSLVRIRVKFEAIFIALLFP